MQRALFSVALAIAIGVSWIYLLPVAAAVQPIAFNHARHQGLACAVCHRGVEVQAQATLPGTEVCAKCHAGAPAGVDSSQWTNLQRGTANWIRITTVPEHVLFSHRRHVKVAKLDCSSCHGDIGQRTTPARRAPVRLDMITCRGCHTQQGASEDCFACHR
jgi:hypothetical protein